MEPVKDVANLSSISWQAPSRKACAQRAHSLGVQRNTALAHALLPSPSTGTHNLYLSFPLSRHSSWDEPTQLFGERRGNPAPSAQASPSFLGSSSGFRSYSGDRSQGRTVLPSGVTLGAAFQVGASVTKGPLSSVSPGQGCIVLPREEHNEALCRRERDPCLASSSLGSGPPLWVCPGWARPSKRSAGELMFSCFLQGPPSWELTAGFQAI